MSETTPTLQGFPDFLQWACVEVSQYYALVAHHGFQALKILVVVNHRQYFFNISTSPNHYRILYRFKRRLSTTQ